MSGRTQVEADELRGLSVCTTGIVPGLKRDEVDYWVQRLGGYAVDKVNDRTDILIYGDRPGSVKMAAARRAAIRMMPAADFLEVKRKYLAIGLAEQEAERERARAAVRAQAASDALATLDIPVIPSGPSDPDSVDSRWNALSLGVRQFIGADPSAGYRVNGVPPGPYYLRRDNGDAMRISSATALEAEAWITARGLRNDGMAEPARWQTPEGRAWYALPRALRDWIGTPPPSQATLQSTAGGSLSLRVLNGYEWREIGIDRPAFLLLENWITEFMRAVREASDARAAAAAANNPDGILLLLPEPTRQFILRNRRALAFVPGPTGAGMLIGARDDRSVALTAAQAGFVRDYMAAIGLPLIAQAEAEAAPAPLATRATRLALRDVIRAVLDSGVGFKIETRGGRRRLLARSGGDDILLDPQEEDTILGLVTAEALGRRRREWSGQWGDRKGWVRIGAQGDYDPATAPALPAIIPEAAPPAGNALLDRARRDRRARDRQF